MIAAGFDNGDVNMFDLRNMKLQWSTNVGNGVCSLQYDRMGNYIYKRLIFNQFNQNLSKVGCVILMVVVHLLTLEEFVPNDHWEDGPHFS